eukprot:TRINITY_DN16582_c0_g1_i2.p1 TRINITY_DN16582_c0_g1~~TRINITY_DN16582_c0_g1_i2.p1  ORF type:complete len:378 (-),score=96.29 TRINITY_DN16582_c0_g1_i2:598-1731(-)
MNKYNSKPYKGKFGRKLDQQKRGKSNLKHQRPSTKTPRADSALPEASDSRAGSQGTHSGKRSAASSHPSAPNPFAIPKRAASPSRRAGAKRRKQRSPKKKRSWAPGCAADNPVDLVSSDEEEPAVQEPAPVAEEPGIGNYSAFECQAGLEDGVVWCVLKVNITRLCLSLHELLPDKRTRRLKELSLDQLRMHVLSKETRESSHPPAVILTHPGTGGNPVVFLLTSKHKLTQLVEVMLPHMEQAAPGAVLEVLSRRETKQLKLRNRWLWSVAVSKGDCEFLKPCQFLNDNVVDFYLLHVHSSVMSKQLRSRCHLFNSFFYTRLTQPQGIEQVRKWTPDCICSTDIILIPVNLQSPPLVRDSVTLAAACTGLLRWCLAS